MGIHTFIIHINLGGILKITPEGGFIGEFSKNAHPITSLQKKGI
jgi:hypothetical protein